MKTLITIMIVSAGLMADETMQQRQMRWQMEKQTEIMQQQLDLQKKQMQQLQMQQNNIQGQQDQMNGRINLAPIQNFMMDWK